MGGSGSQRPEAGGQNSEIRDQNAEGRSPRPEVFCRGAQRCALFRSRKSEAGPEKVS